MTSLPTTEVKRARPSLNVYTALLLVALLVGITGAAFIAMSNMDVSGQGPFDLVSKR